jgi:hypothetical protein
MVKNFNIIIEKKASTYSVDALYYKVKTLNYPFLSASAPETISKISLVIAACLALL